MSPDTDKEQFQREAKGAGRRRGVLAWAKEWGIVGAGIAALFGFITIIGAVVILSILAISERKLLTESRSRTEERLAGVDREISALSFGLGELVASNEAARSDFGRRLPELLDDYLKRAARSGEPVLAVESAAAIVRKARELKIPSDPEHAAVVGRAFLRIANNDRGTIPAMDTVQELLGYRSFLLPPVFDDPDRGIVAHNAMLMLSRLHDFQPLKSESQIYGYIRPFRGMETSNATARLNILGRSNSILPVDAYQAVLTEGYEVKIDGLDARNIAFNNCKIIYSGGSLILENVYFSNCTFELDKSGMEFAAAALSSSGEVSLVKR